MIFSHNHHSESIDNNKETSVPEPTLNITLTETELYYIDDAISFSLPCKSPSLSFITNTRKLIAAPMDLIEKVGACIAEIVSTGNKTAKLDITFIHAIILREMADSQIYINEEPVGLRLKRKLHSLLFQDSYESKLKTQKLMEDINRGKK